jgi:predicted PurR-regulated permease PerM
MMDVDRLRRAGQVAWALLGCAVVLAVLMYLGWLVRVIWPPLILAGAIVFLLNPVVTWLQQRRVPRAAGTGLAYLGVVGLVVLGGVLVAPQAHTQWDELADEWPDLREQIKDWVDDRAEDSRDNDWPIEIPTFDEIEDAIGGGSETDPDTNHDGHVSARERERAIEEEADTNSDGRVSTAERDRYDEERQERLLDNIDTVRELVVRVIEIGLIFIIGPIIAFYLLVDLPHIRRVAEGLIPESRRGEALLVGRRLNRAIGGYFRGQLAIAAIVGTMASIGLAIVGLDFWLVVGLIAGLFNMVPLIGPYIGAVPGVVIALTTADVRTAIWVVVIMVVVQQIDNHFISPVVMQRAVKLHPAVVMLALLAGGTLGGFFGLLMAVPVTAVLKVLLGHLWRTYVLGEPLAVEALAFAAEDAQPGTVVEDVFARDEAGADAGEADAGEADAGEEPGGDPPESPRQ